MATRERDVGIAAGADGVNVIPAQAAARLLNGGAPVVEAAVDDLVNDGLAERDGAQVRASTAAWRFDALWPARA